MATSVVPQDSIAMDARTQHYSIFTRNEKRYIVLLIALAGWFSTLSSFIYYPVIALVAKDLHTSIARINLTVTSYLAVSGIAPAFVGDAADMLGRRPLYIVTLVIYLAANIGIGLQGAFVALLLLRMLQSLGISGTFSTAYGVIADISTPAERGSYVAALSFGITTAPSAGPLIGGALGNSIGWRWIFWFLCILSGSCLIAMFLTLPETARNLVGDGSVNPPKLSRLPLKGLMHRQRKTEIETEISPKKITWHIPNPMKSLIILARKDTLCLVIGGGIVYMVYCCIHASLSSIFIEVYGLNQLEAGLIYLPFGAGSTISTLFSGKLIDRDYRRVVEKYSLPFEKVKGDDLARFPIEEARTPSVFLPLAIVLTTVVSFGWTLQARTHIAIPLVLQFIAGLAIQTCFNINSTLLIDINEESPAAAQASSNIILCEFAALAVAVLQDILDAVGAGWTFTMLGLLCLITVGLYLLIRKKGMEWRLESKGQSSIQSTQTLGHSVDLERLQESNHQALSDIGHRVGGEVERTLDHSPRTKLSTETT